MPYSVLDAVLYLVVMMYDVCVKMIGGADGIDAGYDPDHRDSAGARVGPPPDLPSLLLHNRIVYLGMPLVPAVTELIMAEVMRTGTCVTMTSGIAFCVRCWLSPGGSLVRRTNISSRFYFENALGAR